MNRLTIVGDTEGGYGNSVDDTLLYHRNVVSHSGRAASPRGSDRSLQRPEGDSPFRSVFADQ